MDIELDLYRHEVRVSTNPLVRLSAIDVLPDHPQRTFVFIHGFGGKAEQWQYQMQKFAVENRVIAYCKRRLPGHLVPRFVIFLDDFPRTFIGKVVRHRLQDLVKKWEREAFYKERKIN